MRNEKGVMAVALIMATSAMIGTALGSDTDEGQPVQPGEANAQTIKVLHVTGGGFHDFAEQSKIIPRLITSRGDFEVDVIGPDWDAAKKALSKAGWADGYDIVVYNICDAHQTDETLINTVSKVHTEGTTPAVVIHGSLHSFHWKMGTDKTKFEGEEWLKVVGMASGSHGRRAAITVSTIQEDHPIMKGLPRTWTTPDGELYNSHDVLPSTTPLAMGDNGSAKQGPQVCIWVNQCGKSRVFGTSLGHHNATMEADVYGDMLVRGILWACGRL
jgi:uncharacterized protein